MVPPRSAHVVSQSLFVLPGRRRSRRDGVVGVLSNACRRQERNDDIEDAKDDEMDQDTRGRLGDG